MSSGARIRPRKLLRSSSRCTVLGVPDADAFLARTDERSGGRMVVAPVLEPEAATTLSGEARFYRRLDTVVTVGAVALLGALGGFMLGERLLSPRTTPLPAFPSAVLSTTPPPLPDAAPSRATGSSPPDSARSFVNLVPDRSAAQASFEPPWRDRAAMRQGTFPVSAESFAALVLDNRRLDAEVVALEAETTSLEKTLLHRELRLFLAGLPIDDVGDAGGFFDGAGRDFASEPPIPAGDERLPDTAAYEEEVYEEEVYEEEVYEEEVYEEEVGDDFAELELFASELESGPLEASAVGEKTIASAAMGAPQQRLVIAEVEPGSTVENVGLLPGDILMTINGEEVFGLESLIEGADGNLRGELYELIIARDGASFPLPYAGDLADLSLRVDWIDPVFTER